MEEVEKGRGVIILHSFRYANHPTDVKRTMTVDELIGFLEWCPPGWPVVIEGYDGHQFSPVDEDAIEQKDRIE